MKLWALSDPHLGFALDKTMDMFGKNWGDHSARLAAAWRGLVSDEDVVLLSGDISWAINYAELEPDFRFLDALPGRKIIGRGNHDYWWASLQKNRQFCAEKGFKGFEFLRNNAFRLPDEPNPQGGRGLVLCGTRGWITPAHPDWKAADEKYYQRELIRLRLSLEDALSVRQDEDALLVALHYPPFGPDGGASLFTDLLETFEVDICIFGHVHGEKGRRIARREAQGIFYFNTACDILDCTPLLLWDWSAKR